METRHYQTPNSRTGSPHANGTRRMDEGSLMSTTIDTIPQVKAKKLFRIESVIHKRSLWYRNTGEFDPIITALTDGQSASLPMGHDDLYGAENTRWFSACDNLDLLRTWFSAQDAYELGNSGFVLREFDVVQWKDLPMETIFTQESVVKEKEISIHTVWDVTAYTNDSTPTLPGS